MFISPLHRAIVARVTVNVISKLLHQLSEKIMIIITHAHVTMETESYLPKCIVGSVAYTFPPKFSFYSIVFITIVILFAYHTPKSHKVVNLLQ